MYKPRRCVVIKKIHVRNIWILNNKASRCTWFAKKFVIFSDWCTKWEVCPNVKNHTKCCWHLRHKSQVISRQFWSPFKFRLCIRELYFSTEISFSICANVNSVYKRYFFSMLNYILKLARHLKFSVRETYLFFYQRPTLLRHFHTNILRFLRTEEGSAFRVKFLWNPMFIYAHA